MKKNKNRERVVHRGGWILIIFVDIFFFHFFFLFHFVQYITVIKLKVELVS